MDAKLRDWTKVRKYINRGEPATIFTGENPAEAERLQMANLLATHCPCYREDEEEELAVDGQVSCYNCRYRRWLPQGFSCYKGFPVPEIR